MSELIESLASEELGRGEELLAYGIGIAVVKVDYDSIGVDLPEDVKRVEEIISHR